MNKALKTILIVFLILAVLAAGFWYFFLYRSGLPASLYASYAGFLEKSGHYTSAARFYGKAMDLTPEDADLALRAADAYEKAGNNTKAEYTLVRSISRNPESVDLYLALSGLYIREDKLLDAERLVSACANETVRETLMEMRPAAPVIQPEGGFTLEPTTFALSYAGGTAFYSLTAEYPTTAEEPYGDPVPLDYGVTTVSAIVVGENDLVSTLSTAEFTVCGEIEAVVFEDEAFDALIREQLGKGTHAEILSTELWTVSELTIPAEISNLTDLSHFVGLKVLNLQDSAAADLSVLASLPSLTSLDISGRSLSADDLTAIGSIATLTELHMGNCDAVSLDALAGLTELTVLEAPENRISDISALAAMPSLREVNLSGNEIATITPLTASTQLTALDLSDNQISSLGAISANTALTTLNVSSCEITDLSPLENKSALTTLDVSSNQITDVTALRGCTALLDLKLTGNEITDLSPIAVLTGLESLDASSNLLEQSPSFPEGSSLLTLNLSFNRLTEVDGLVNLHKLNYVCLNDNRLTDISAIADLASLLQVDAYHNPLVGVASLEERSILVNYDPGYVLPEEEEDDEEGDAEGIPNEGLSLDGQVQNANGG